MGLTVYAQVNEVLCYFNTNFNATQMEESKQKAE
jgi:hypothetical protein